MATRIQRSRGLPPSEKATYHQITGAGKSRIKREFFGLSPRDEEIIERAVDQALTVHLETERP